MAGTKDSSAADTTNSTTPVLVGKPEAQATKASLKRDLTEGSIPKNLWFLAWPQSTEGMLSILDHLADILWAGRLGASSIAGLGVAQSYVSLSMTGRMGFDTAMRAMVSRAIGAKDEGFARHVAFQAFTLSGIFSLIMVFVGFFLTDELMKLIGISDAVIAAGVGYMKVQLVGMGAMALRMSAAAALQASGDAVTPLKATTATRLINLALSPCLVFGLLFFPEFGLTGAAISGVTAQFVGSTINLRALFTGRSQLHLRLEDYRLDLPLIWRLVRLGAPASVTSAERSLAQIILIGIVAPFGDYALAAYALTRRIELVPTHAMMGLGQATGILVGQNLGAGRPERARSTVGWSMGMSALFHVVIASAFFVFAEGILSVFNQEPELLGPAVIWLRIQVVGYVFLGASTVFAQTYNTAGDTLIPMLTALGTMWLVQQPLALTLPHVFGLGEYGISWAINIALAVRLFVFVPYFFQGAWMRKKLI